MNNIALIEAVEALDAAITMTIDPGDRATLQMLLHGTTMLLRKQGVFIGTKNKFHDIPLWDRVQMFRRELASMEALKENLFPSRCPVKVNAPQYRGYGIRLSTASEPAASLNVLLENGNAWLYPLECCERVKWSDVPAPDRRAYLRWRGYKLVWSSLRGRLP